MIFFLALLLVALGILFALHTTIMAIILMAALLILCLIAATG